MKQKREKIYGVKSCLAALLLCGGVLGLNAAGDAGLKRLEIKVGGTNILSDFNKATKNYEIELGEDAASIATFSAAPASADAVVNISVNGRAFTNHSVGKLTSGENIITYTVQS
ncbi:MAG: hypothetical protein K2H18_04290, partial [Muribaculaceae bacterium]|nr:hypothetical protein [Muribaculaceae bacterium]